MKTDAEQPKRAAQSAYDLNFEYFEKVAHANGWMTKKGFNTQAIADAVGMSDEQVRRVLSRKARPGASFMSGLQRADTDFRIRLMFPLAWADEPIRKD